MPVDHPNLLYVFADQWRRGAMGCAGEDPVQTPRMDAFAKTGVRCTACTSTFPLCSPHRASLLTGRYPLSVGFFTNCKTGLSMELDERERTLGDVLKAHGYQTAYVGKLHLDEPEQNRCPAPVSGARGWDAYTPPGPRRHGFDFWYSYGACDQHLHPHYWHDTPEMIQVGQWSPEHETDVAIRWLEQLDRSRPFAAVISWNPPHSPYDQVPQKYLDLYPETVPLKANVDVSCIHQHTGEPADCTVEELQRTTRRYYAAVSGLDDQFGRLLDALKRLDLADNTIVVLSSDHGDMMGSHGLMAKHVWYEESIGIPFVAAGPGIGRGLCGSVIGSQDQMPTLLGLLGLPVPSCVEGLDCSFDIRSAVTDPEKATFLCACPGREVFLKTFARAGEDPRAFGWRGIRTARYTYVIDAGYAPRPQVRRLLYDLRSDPLQNDPLHLSNAGEHPVAARLEARVAQWLRQSGDGFIRHLATDSAPGKDGN